MREKYAVNIQHLSDDVLAFFGFTKIWEVGGFKVYRDKYQEHHLVESSFPYIFVESRSDADALRSSEIVVVRPA